MKRTVILIVIIILVIMPFVVTGIRTYRQQGVKEELRKESRYDGFTGPTITAFDNRNDRWIAEMKEEPVEVTLQKSTDAEEYMEYLALAYSSHSVSAESEKMRDKSFYSKDIDIVLSNRRFRKAYDDIKKTDRKRAAALLTKNIRENLEVLRVMHQSDIEVEAQGKYNDYSRMYPDENSYRRSSDPNMPPTRFGRRFALFSYLLLASFFELKEVRPAIEEVIQFAKEEYRYFNSIPGDSISHLHMSMYNPSLLLTATLCDPNWNAGKKKLLESKLKNREVVDWEARALEQDRDAMVGLLPVKPDKEMISIRYYQGITDAEFDAFLEE